MNKNFVVHGWTLFAHPLFLSQVEALVKQVDSLRQEFPKDYKKKNATKRLAIIYKLAFDIIPQDLTKQESHLGDTLGKPYKHWFRIKFFQQYRLFFRYHLESKIIIYGWVNDTNTKRDYDSKTDVYCIFQKMLNSGYSPNHWQELLDEARAEEKRLKQISESDAI